MDFEANDKHDLVLIAADNKVHTLSLSTFEEARGAVEIPTSSNAFHNEGGVSLSPDGKTFFAVRDCLLFLSIYDIMFNRVGFLLGRC